MKDIERSTRPKPLGSVTKPGSLWHVGGHVFQVQQRIQQDRCVVKRVGAVNEDGDVEWTEAFKKKQRAKRAREEGRG